MTYASSSREDLEMCASAKRPVSLPEWTPNIHGGTFHQVDDNIFYPESSQYEALHRAKRASKPIRSSPLAGPSFFGERPNTSMEAAGTISFVESPPFQTTRGRSILSAEPLSFLARSKSSRSDKKRPTLQIFTSSTSRPFSSSDTSSANLTSSPSPSSLNNDQISACYRLSACEPSTHNAVSESPLGGLGSSRQKRHSHRLRRSSPVRPSVIISPTETIFRPFREITCTSAGSRTAQPPTQPRGQPNQGESAGTFSFPSEPAFTSPVRSSPIWACAELSPHTPPLRTPSPSKSKPILKHASASRLPPGMPLPEAASGITPVKPPLKDNSWFVNSPYTITPPFTRLGLNAPGVVLPLSVKEYKRRTATKASLARASTGVRRHSESGKEVSGISSYDGFSTLSSTTGRRRVSHGLSNLTGNTAATLPQSEAQQQGANMTPSSQFGCQPRPRTIYDTSTTSNWGVSRSESSAASSASSLPLTLPSSSPDSTTLASHTPSVRSAAQTETSSICTTIAGTGMDDKSEETAVAHGARVEVGREEPDEKQEEQVEAEVTVRAEIPTLSLKKRRSVLERVKSFCWAGTSTGVCTSKDANKPACVTRGAIDYTALPLLAAAAAPARRRSNARHSLPIMPLSPNSDAWVVPDIKGDAASCALTTEKPSAEVAQAVVPQVPAAVLPTIREEDASAQVHRFSSWRAGPKKKLHDGDGGVGVGVEVEVRYLDLGIVDSETRKAQKGNGSVKSVWKSLKSTGKPPKARW